MNKVLIRTRQIDNNKQLPILLRENDDLSDFHEYSNTNRGSQILSGMDKGEESEHHFQEALRELDDDKTITSRAIPIPDVEYNEKYSTLYKNDFKLPKTYIRVKILDLEDELPDYDMDHQDEEWFSKHNLSISKEKFEYWIEHFERSSTQKLILYEEAKAFFRDEPADDVNLVYSYWLKKRLEAHTVTLILSIKAEKNDKTNNGTVDPYVAFRKRSEKMTTRKNRRVDESSYEKMYRLKQEMMKLGEIIQLISRREAIKLDRIKVEKSIFIKRYESKDYDKIQLKETESLLKKNSIKVSDNFKSAQRIKEENQKENKRKRPNSKSVESVHISNSTEEEDFTFRPMSKCKYLPIRYTEVSFNSDSSVESQFINDPKKFSYSSLSRLPEPLRGINAPVRLRMNKDRSICIDVQRKQTADLIRHNSFNQSLDRTETVQEIESENIKGSNVNSQIFSYQGPKKRQRILEKLHFYLSTRIFSGLKPLHITDEINSSTQFDSSRDNAHSNQSANERCMRPNGEDIDSLHNHSSDIDSNRNSSNFSPSINGNNNNHKSFNFTSQNNVNPCFQISNNKSSKFRTHPTSCCDTKTCKNQINNNSSMSSAFDNICSVNSSRINFTSISPHKCSNNLSVYKSNNHQKSLHEPYHHLIKSENKICSDVDKWSGFINGYGQSTVSKDQSEVSQSNHSCNDGVKMSNRTSSKKNSVSCLKSLTNHQLTSDSEIFTSKSNGHVQPSDYGNRVNRHVNQHNHQNNNNDRNHSNNHSHINHNHHTPHKWLNSPQTDSYLKTSNLLPLWKSDQHAVSSVNKIT